MWHYLTSSSPKQPKHNHMFAARELKVGKRYKAPDIRGLGPCNTLTRKRHLANGTKYELTFDNGKRRWQFYNFTEKPAFKACRQRHSTRKQSHKK